MKEKENFDEIEELDEVEEIDEIEDIDVDDEIDDEVYSKKETSIKSKPKKANKKKLGKGAKVGIGVGSAVVAIALIAVIVWFLILPMFNKEDNRTAAERFSGTLGTTKPTATATQSINANMTAGEMLLKVVDNYYNADYVASICVEGGVKTTIGTLNVDQGVNSFKVRDGKYTENNTNNAKYYVYSKSFGIANMYEEYYSTGNNTTYKKASKNSIKNTKLEDNRKHYGTKKWDAKVTYDSIDDFIAATSTDFTKLWSYEVNEETITNFEDSVEYKNGCYYFTIKLDLEKATAAYVDVMKYQLGSNMGFTVNSLVFKDLEFEFCVWDNGFIRYFNVKESYQMDCSGVPMIGKLNMGITNICMNEFSFDKTEKVPYDVYNATTKEVEVVDFDMDTFIENF